MNPSPFVYTPVISNLADTVTQVDTYADLPDASLQANKFFYVKTTTGIWLINRKLLGFYRSNGISWEYVGDTGTDIANRFINTAAPLTGGGSLANNLTLGLDTEMLNTSSTITSLSVDTNVEVGDFVYVNSSGQVKLAQANDISTAFTIGVVVQKINPTAARILTDGASTDIFTGLSIGARYFLSSELPGKITTIVPINPSSCILSLGVALSSTEILINKQQILIRSF